MKFEAESWRARAWRPRVLVAVLLVASGGMLRPAGATDPSIVLFHEDFEQGPFDRWVEGGFPSIARRNTFSIVADPDGNHYLRVQSSDSYSGKGVHLRFSSRRCPEARWRWRVSDVVAGADLTKKEGDDGAAKFYVVFTGPSSWNPLDKRLLVYLWDRAAPAGAVLPNVWLPAKARMVVLESGRERLGQWVSERVDLFTDFARAFPGETPGEVEGFAFLADTDNTHGRAESDFDDLEIRCGR